jgi:hypothetical protein
MVADSPWPATETRYKVAVRGSKVDDALAWPHHVSVLFFYEIPLLDPSLRSGVYYIQKWLVVYVAAMFAVQIGIVITAGFIPNMLAKGSLDLLASKPIGRTTLMVYKYVGGLMFMAILTATTVLGVWVVIGLRTGLWSANFLVIIPLLMFYFAVLYAVSTFIAVLTRNTITAITVTSLVWGLLTVVGKLNDGVRNLEDAEAADKAAGIVRPIDPNMPLWGFIPRYTFGPIKALHTVSPRTYDLDTRLGRLIAEGVLTPYELKQKGYDKPAREDWGEIFGVSLAFIALMLGLSCWRFNTRDF